MAEEAAKAAGHMLTMCIRALDYVPPVDLTFGDYLRALVTADYDLVRDDDLHYRVAVVSAFRDWGIYPEGVHSLSVDSLLLCPPETDPFPCLVDVFRNVADEDNGKRQGLQVSALRAADPHARVGNLLVDWKLRSDRLKVFVGMRQDSLRLHDWIKRSLAHVNDEALGLALGADAPRSIRRDADGIPVFEVHSLRPCHRIGPDGQERIDVVLEVVQRAKAFFDPGRQEQLDSGRTKTEWKKIEQDFMFRGGCSLIIDPETGRIRYYVAKPIAERPGDGRAARPRLKADRLDRERRFRQGQFGDPAMGVYPGNGACPNPFRFLHGVH
jgi:hypothetical protein